MSGGVGGASRLPPSAWPGRGRPPPPPPPFFIITLSAGFFGAGVFCFLFLPLSPPPQATHFTFAHPHHRFCPVDGGIVAEEVRGRGAGAGGPFPFRLRGQPVVLAGLPR